MDEPIIVKLDIDMMGPDRQKYTLLSGSLGSRKFHFRESIERLHHLVYNLVSQISLSSCVILLKRLAESTGSSRVSEAVPTLHSPSGAIVRMAKLRRERVGAAPALSPV